MCDDKFAKNYIEKILEHTFTDHISLDFLEDDRLTRAIYEI